MKTIQLTRAETLTGSTTFATDELGNPLTLGTYRGVRLAIDVTALSTDVEVKPAIWARDPVTGTWGVVVEGVPIATVSSVALTVLPELTPIANSAASAALANAFRVALDYTGSAGNCTITLGLVKLP
jgi:hypothetical protein